MGRGQVRHFAHGLLPVGGRGFILLFVVEELAQVIMGFRRGGQQRERFLQDPLFDQPVREAQVEYVPIYMIY